MSFTKKHYEETARIINDARNIRALVTKHEAEEEYVNGYRAAALHISLRLSRMFSADNPRFDAERFARACEPNGGAK